MRPLHSFVALAGVAGAAVFAGLGPAWSQQESPPARSPRGGLIAQSGQHRFEVFFFPTGVRVYPQGPEGQPVDVSRAAATVTFYHPNSPKPWFSRALTAEAAARGQAPASLEHAIGLANVPARGVRVAFDVTGLPGPAGSTAAFTVPFEFAPAPAPSAAATLPTAPPAGAAPVARYVYGYGNAGYGYYPYTSPGTAAPRAVAQPYYGNTMRFPEAGHEVGPNHRDWATGRDVRLAKPWMQPFDD
jgi:hypothetical protein